MTVLMELFEMVNLLEIIGRFISNNSLGTGPERKSVSS